MFDFEKLNVYQESKLLHREILQILKERKSIDPYIRDQLRRAVTSIVINIAEGSGRFSKADKRNFYIISRGSVYESVSLLDLMRDHSDITVDEQKNFYHKFETISKMLLGLINNIV